MKRKTNSGNDSSINVNIFYSIGCLITSAIFILGFLLNERSLNLEIGAFIGVLLIAISIALFFMKNSSVCIQEMSVGVVILAMCSGIYFFASSLVFNFNSKGPLYIYFASMSISILLRFIFKSHILKHIEQKNLLFYKIDICVTTLIFILYQIFTRMVISYETKPLKDIRTFIALIIVLNICVFCATGIIAIYYRHKYNIKFMDVKSGK